jgi:hypothetical protein
MNHIERYLEELKKGGRTVPQPSVPIDVDLPGLKQGPGLSSVRRYELKCEWKGLLASIEKNEKKLKQAKGEEKKAVTASIKQAKTKIKEVLLILGPIHEGEETMSHGA